MWLFRRKPDTRVKGRIQKEDGHSGVKFEPTVLRKNNITRLSIDERWTKLFVTIKISPELDRAEKEMGELIKREAMLKNEQENLEPQKRRLMNEIMNLTKEAFDDNSDEAKSRLSDCKSKIEKINVRINNILEDIEKLNDGFKTANLKLLEDSMTYIFSTLKAGKDRASSIQNELQALEQREKELKEEFKTISVDWTKYALDITELIGPDEVKKLETEFGDRKSVV